VRKHRGQQELDAVEFMQLIREKAKLLEMNQEMLTGRERRVLGGEKKRNEIFQMAVLEPSWRFSTRPTRVSTSTRCASCRRASTRCAARSRDRSS
jgi:hypothetical protein